MTILLNIIESHKSVSLPKIISISQQFHRHLLSLFRHQHHFHLSLSSQNLPPLLRTIEDILCANHGLFGAMNCKFERFIEPFIFILYLLGRVLQPWNFHKSALRFICVSIYLEQASLLVISFGSVTNRSIAPFTIRTGIFSVPRTWSDGNRPARSLYTLWSGRGAK